VWARVATTRRTSFGQILSLKTMFRIKEYEFVMSITFGFNNYEINLTGMLLPVIGTKK
jgi:hypothetical protein